MLAPLQHEDCFSNIPQDFLICTTIHKARELGVFHGHVYVTVLLDSLKRQTKMLAHSENPYFNEYFVFEIKCTLSELLRLTMMYKVKKHAACKRNMVLGELLVDMQSVWNQPNRSYFKKWGRLERVIEEKPAMASAATGRDSYGFLQIDLAIVSLATNALMKPVETDLMLTNAWQMNQDYDNIENNLLEDSYSNVSCNILYTVTFYRAFVCNKSDYMLQFRFHPFRGKTNVSKNTTNPVWNQAISFAWSFPSLSQTFLIQLMAHEHMQWKSVGECEIHFDEIAFNGEGGDFKTTQIIDNFLHSKEKPSMGPCFIHMYDSVTTTKYIGRLLLEIQSECLESKPQRQIHVKTVVHLDEQRYWDEGTFRIEFAPLQGDFVHGNFSNCKISINIGEQISNNVECFLKPYPMNKVQKSVVNNLKYFRHVPPYKAVTCSVKFPDNRRKYEMDIFAWGLINFVRNELDTFKQFQIQYSSQKQSQIKVLREIINTTVNMLKVAFKDGKLEYKGLKQHTKYGEKRFQQAKVYFENFANKLKTLRSSLKTSKDAATSAHRIEETLREIVKILKTIETFLVLTPVENKWPDLLIMLHASHKAIAVCRLNVKDFVQMPDTAQDELTMGHCWKVRNFIFKAISCQHTCNNCGCIIALVLGCLSIVYDKEIYDFQRKLTTSWRSPEPFYWTPTKKCIIFKCRAFVHQAKIRPGADRNGLCDPYVRVMVSSYACETPVILGTLSPIWNSVFSFDHIQFPGYLQWYKDNPPLLAIELYDTDKNTADDYLGCAFVKMSVITKEWLAAHSDKGSHSISWWRKTPALQKFQSLKCLSPPPLKWIPIAANGIIMAEILMSVELLETDEKDCVGDDDNNARTFEKPNISVGIPAVIRPNMKNFVLEVVFAGFRNYKRTTVFSSRHRVRIMMAELELTSGLSAPPARQSMNFFILFASGVVSLPEQLEYWPAIIATDVAVSSKQQETTLGAALISNSRRFFQVYKQLPCIEMDDGQEESEAESTAMHMNEFDYSETSPLLKKRSGGVPFWRRLFCLGKSQDVADTDDFDLSDLIDQSDYNWWTKFYNSGVVEPCGVITRLKHQLCVYPNELEKQPEFSYFNDWAEPLQMVHGVRRKRTGLPIEQVYATLKLNIKITPCRCDKPEHVDSSRLKPLSMARNPRHQAQLKSLTDMQPCAVRAYIVQGLQLRPSAKLMQANSYVRIQLGNQHVGNRSDYVAKDSNPIYGKSFDLEGLLPREHILQVSVFNHNHLLDEHIGSTYIDLEDRWRSKHRGTVGVANEFSSFGYNKWRDSKTPSEILHELCMKNFIRPPKIDQNTVEVDGVSFEDETELAIGEDLQERLSLTVLKNLEHLPSFGYKLVPEHVETRPLYRPDQPGIEQGKIQLWLELYDGNVDLPPAINLVPHPPLDYELRVIVIGVSDVIMEERNVFGSAMSDIYVKGWVSDTNQAQYTDIHYRSLNGEGQFNWRMKFPLKYSSVEDMIIVKRNVGLLEVSHTKHPPKLSLQIWDKDMISQDDFLGSLEIHLSHFSPPFETAKKCQLTDYENVMCPKNRRKMKLTGKTPRSSLKLLNIFRQKKVKGWFPLRGLIPEKNFALGLAGKIHLELEMVTEEEAFLYPVGIARDPPEALEPPERPDTSFNPFTHPWKGIKQIIIPGIGKYILCIGLLALLGFAIFLLVMNFPAIVAIILP